MRLRLLRQLIMAMIVILIFEGVIRKLLPGPLSKLFILVKDGIALMIAVGVLQSGVKGIVGQLMMLHAVFAIALIPLILNTFLIDPVLAFFGAKQYLLFHFISYGIVKGFSDFERTDFTRPYKFIALTIYITAPIALIQLKLGAGHWLNLSVSGEDLSGFSAGGNLRVSATFPFIAQFSWYLMAISYAYAISFSWKPKTGRFKKLFHLPTMLLLLIVANFITGSRTAVMGNLVVVVFAGGLLMVRGSKRGQKWLIGLVIFGAVAYQGAQYLFPSAFVAFKARSSDTASFVDSDEMKTRIEHAFLGWTGVYKRKNAGAFGFGLGTMSNGVQSLSKYADALRKKKIWGETDLANTVLEGGYYLVVIWMLFRVSIILICIKVYLSIKHSKIVFCAAFLTGYIIFNGLTGTFGIQPPTLIWWHFAIGGLMVLSNYEKFLVAKKRSDIKSAKQEKFDQKELDRNKVELENANNIKRDDKNLLDEDAVRRETALNEEYNRIVKLE